jgi:pimeloyl-ACP methyl ester carboxylesterase
VAPTRLVTIAVAASLALVACDRTEANRERAIEGSTPVSFESADGVRLEGRQFGPASASVGVVLSHMLPADQRSWYPLADALGNRGYIALTYDFRGYCPGGDGGCSQGAKDVGAVVQDLAGAVEFVRELGVQEIVLIGASMGGTASLAYAASEPAGIAAVVAVSAPSSIGGISVGPATIECILGAKLFIAGLDDGNAAADAEAFYNAGPPPKRVEILTTGDHGTEIFEGAQGSRAQNLVLTWLAQVAPASG